MPLVHVVHVSPAALTGEQKVFGLAKTNFRKKYKDKKLTRLMYEEQRLLDLEVLVEETKIPPN